MNRIDVLLGEAQVTPADVVGRVVVVIDVLRAATTVATALANGARAVYPFESVDEAARHGAEMDRDSILLAGERRMVRIDGFDLGNSPLEFTPDVVRGRTVLCTTTNGTPALVATHGARACFLGGFVNFSATVSAIRALDVNDVTVLCSGQDRRASLEDVVCAGRFVEALCGDGELPSLQRGDGAFIAQAIARPYKADLTTLADDATHARSLRAAGFGADVSYCLALDTVPVAVTYRALRLERA